MTQRNTVNAIVVSIALLSLGLMLFNNYRASRLHKQKAVQEAILRFSTDSATRHIGFDRVYAANNTVSYYKLGALAGRSVLEYH